MVFAIIVSVLMFPAIFVIAVLSMHYEEREHEQQIRERVMEELRIADEITETAFRQQLEREQLYRDYVRLFSKF